MKLLASQTSPLCSVPLEEEEQVVGSFAIQFDQLRTHNLKRLRYVLSKSEYNRAIKLKRVSREEKRAFQIAGLRQSNENLIRENKRLMKLIEMRNELEDKSLIKCQEG